MTTDASTSPRNTVRARVQALPVHARIAFLSATGLLFTVILCSFAGAPRFFVSTQALSVLAVPALVLAVLMCVGLSPAVNAPKPGKSESPAKPATFLQKVVPLLMAFGLCVAVVTDTVPFLANGLIGERFEATFTVAAKAYESGRSSHCYRLDLSELESSWFGKLCVDSSSYRSARRGTLVVMHGRRSWFGTQADQWQVGATQ